MGADALGGSHVTPTSITFSRLDRRLHGESWRMSHHHRDPATRAASRSEYLRHVARHLADAVRALEGMS